MKCTGVQVSDLNLYLKNVTLPTVFFKHFVSSSQQPGFFISGTSEVSTQGIYKTSNSNIAEIHPNNTILPGKSPCMIILVSEIGKFAQIWWSVF